MSTKVYDAYVFNGRNGRCHELEELLDSLKVIRDKYVTSFKDRMVQLFSFANSTLADSDYFMEVAKLIILSMKEGYNVMSNPEASAMVYPHQGRLLVKFFGMEKVPIEDDRYMDYHYQDHTDMPEDVDELKWAERRNTWDVLLGAGSWAENGFSFEFIPPHFAWEVAEEVVRRRRNVDVDIDSSRR